MDRAMFDFLAKLDADAGKILESSPRSVSLITGPSGVSVGEERCDEEGVVYAELDLSECVEPKQFHDVSGGYNRFDIFQLTVNRTPNRPIQFASFPERESQSEDTASIDDSTDQC
jgi:aliphatic nitrilase